MRPRRTDLLICGGLVGLILLIYAQTASHAFIQYDDPLYVTDNPVVQRGLTLDGIRWSLQGSADGNWIPLTWLSHMADVQFFGLDAGRQHLVSVAIHAVNSILLFLLLMNLIGARWRSALVAALWAVHPLHVESVAWIAERKDVLSALFFFLAIGAYARYARTPSTPRYILVLLLFLLGMMAKPMVMTLPGVLLLLDYWPLGRLSSRSQLRRSLLEKLPMIALAIACAVVTLIAQHYAGAVRTLGQFPATARLGNAVVSIARYLAKTAWPINLTVFYPPTRWSPASIVLASALVLAITLLSLKIARTRPYLIVGWLWFLGMLVPVIGLVQVGRQAMADRYSYLPHVGLFIVIAWTAGSIAARGKAYRDCIVAGAIVALAGLSITSFVQVRHWQNTETVFAHALLVSDDNDVAHNQVGNVLSRRGDAAGAEAQYRQAVDINPDYALAQMNLGNVLVRRRQFEEATGHFEAALAGTQPEVAKIELGLAVALRGANHYEQSDAMFADVLNREPKLVQAHVGWAESLKDRGRRDEAAAQFKEALKLDPQNALAQHELDLLSATTKPAPTDR